MLLFFSVSTTFMWHTSSDRLHPLYQPLGPACSKPGGVSGRRWRPRHNQAMGERHPQERTGQSSRDHRWGPAGAAAERPSECSVYTWIRSDQVRKEVDQICLRWIVEQKDLSLGLLAWTCWHHTAASLTGTRLEQSGLESKSYLTIIYSPDGIPWSYWTTSLQKRLFYPSDKKLYCHCKGTWSFYWMFMLQRCRQQVLVSSLLMLWAL